MIKVPKIKLFLTFDHELPLGGVRTSWDDALFQPTQKLLDLAEQLDIKVTLFTDVLCAIRFKDWDYAYFYKPYLQQIQTAFNNGHDVQLHLHPHWLTSDYEDGKFIPSNDYSLTDFHSEKAGFDIQKIIQLGVQFLKESIHNPDYCCNAFRAGGYNLGDEVSRPVILHELHRNGIKYDSSIAKGYYFNSEISEVDYRRMPQECNWYLSSNDILNKEDNSSLLEIPIASIPKSPFEIPTFFKMKKYAFRAPLERGFQIHDGKPGSIKNKIKAFLSSRMLGFDNYTYEYSYLLKILDYNIKKYNNEETIMLCAVGHPKTMSNYAYDMMSHFVLNAQKKYPEIEFLTYRNLINNASR